jgi:hypothetical protein
MFAYDDLTEPERAIWDSLTEGVLVRLPVAAPVKSNPANGAGWGGDRLVRARLLYELLTGRSGPENARPRALRLAGARISGTLDLEAATLTFPLTLSDCFFEEPVGLRQAQTLAIRLSGSQLPGLDAEQLATRNDLELDEAAIQGEVNLLGARIGGSLQLSGATLDNPDGTALNANRLVVEQSMYCREGFSARGTVNLMGAQIKGSLSCSGAQLANQGGPALVAQGIKVGRNVFCDQDFAAEGEVDLLNAEIGGQLSFTGAQLSNPRRSALTAQSVTVAGNLLCGPDLIIYGEVNLLGARIGGSLQLSGATLDNPDGTALNANRLVVEQSMYCREGFSARGTVNLMGAQIKGSLSCSGAQLAKQGGPALVAQGMTVGRNVFCDDGFVASGQVDLFSADIGGQLSFRGARFSDDDRRALRLEKLRTGSLVLQLEVPSPGTVDLTNARVGDLLDSEATWPASLRLDGLRYDTLTATPAVDVKTRLAWLRRDPDGYRPQPYEQLATSYRQAGQTEDARKVAIAKQRHRREMLNWRGRAWNRLLDVIVGFGYQTWKAAACLLVLIAVGWLIFDSLYPTSFHAGKPDGQRPAFHAGIYALDLVLPFADLGYQGAWIAEGWARVPYLAWNLAGWILITTVIAALSGLAKRD